MKRMIWGLGFGGSFCVVVSSGWGSGSVSTMGDGLIWSVRVVCGGVSSASGCVCGMSSFSSWLSRISMLFGGISGML